MQALEERVLRDGIVAPGDVLRVDSFVNHQMDVALLSEIAQELHRLFADEGVDRVLTIEASGIGIACLVAQTFGVPMVFAKKSRTSNLPDDVYTCDVMSYTHGNVNHVMVSKEFLHAGERVLLIDDFLAHGEALEGLINIVHQAGAEVVGAGVIIEKAYQGGGDRVRAQGIRVESMARIASMSVEDGIRFVRE